MLRYNAGNLTNSFSVFRVPQNVITYPKTELSHRRKPPPATPSKKDIAAISCPSMQIYNYSDNTARRRSRDSGALNHFSPPTPAKARPRSGQGPTTPPRPPKDQQIMQSIKVGRLLCSVAAIPEWKQHPRCPHNFPSARQTVLNGVKSNRSRNRHAWHRRAAARAEASSGYPGGHGDAQIRSPLRQQAAGERFQPSCGCC